MNSRTPGRATTRHKLARAVLIAVVLTAAALVLRPLTFLNREAFRQQVGALHADLQVGMSRDDVRRLMDPVKYAHLEFDRREAHVWLASAPAEFGAGNWVLWVEFDGNRVSAVRIRTADGVHHHPPGAPLDKQPARGSEPGAES